jgi:dephospho-CoA kinase
MLIALTGGIGCGKSSAARFFEAQGFAVRDADRIVRENVLPARDVIAAAEARWGRAVVGADGGLDRAKVAEIVFAAEGERRWLEKLVHPRVEAFWRAEVAGEPGRDWVIEVPLLFEAGMEKGFDFVITVGASRGVQVARLIARGLSQAQVEQRIASQLPLDHKLKSAHAVLWNDGTPAFLSAQVAQLAAGFRARSAS